jgi:hypothetical protein
VLWRASFNVSITAAYVTCKLPTILGYNVKDWPKKISSHANLYEHKKIYIKHRNTIVHHNTSNSRTRCDMWLHFVKDHKQYLPDSDRLKKHRKPRDTGVRRNYLCVLLRLIMCVCSYPLYCQRNNFFLFLQPIIWSVIIRQELKKQE